MKKTYRTPVSCSGFLTGFILLNIFTVSLYAQTFSVQFSNGFKGTGFPGYDVQVQGTLTNLTPNTLLLDAVRLQNDTAPGWNSAFCLDQCYAPFVDSAQAIIGPNASVLFTVDFYTSSNPDSSHVKMKIKNANNPSETSIFDFFAVTDSGTVGIKTIGFEQEPVTVAPNPFSGSTTVTLNVVNNSNASLPDFILYDLLGKEVKRIKTITGESFILEQEDLPRGIYHYRITGTERKSITGKIIIQ